MKNKGAALGTATNWLCNFIVVEITPIGINSLHWKFYIIWTVFNGAFVPLVYLFYPETAGRTLEDIDRYFMEHDNILVFRDKASGHNPCDEMTAHLLTSTSRPPLPQSDPPSTSSTKSPRSAATAASTRELLRWRWRGTETTCRWEGKGTTWRRRTRRTIVRRCEIVDICYRYHHFQHALGRERALTLSSVVLESGAPLCSHHCCSRRSAEQTAI